MSNKWLQDLQTLKSNTNILRNELQSKGITTSNTDTLPMLIQKVPSLSPIVIGDNWEPDILWKFPDPNGSDILKTIREIYDEDTTTGYTYKGIFQIKGDLSKIDLKKCMNGRSNSDTFVLSDGTTYNNITATTLEHTWDSTKDIIDSKGRHMRYIRVYTNTAFNYNIGWQGQAIWSIWKLSTSLSVYNNWSNDIQHAVNIAFAKDFECLEVEGNISGLSTASYAYYPSCISTIGYPKKLVCIGQNSNYSATLLKWWIPEVEFKNCSNLNNINAWITNSNKVKFTNYTGTTLTISNHLPSYSDTSKTVIKVDTLDLTQCSNVTSIALAYMPVEIKQLLLPTNLTTFDIRGGVYILGTLNIPNTVTSLMLSNATIIRIDSFIINSIPTLVNNLWPTIIGSTNFVIPNGWNISLPSFSYCELSHDCIVDMFNNLADLTGQSSISISLGSYHLGLLTDTEKAIATNKNWTLS